LIVVKGGEFAEAAEVFGGLAEGGGEGAGKGVGAFFGEADAVALGEVLYSNSNVRHSYTSESSIAA